MKIILIVLALTVSITSPGLTMGQQGPSKADATAVLDPAYDVKTEVTFEGKVIRVDPAPCASLPISNEHVHIRVDQREVEIYLGPCGYVQTQKPYIRAGDTISGVGSELMTQNGQHRMIVAREVRRGKEVLRLRDEKGKPLWR